MTAPANNILKLAVLQHAKASWWNDLIKTASGSPIANLANALIILRQDAAFIGMFGFDQMLGAPMLLRPLGDHNNFRPRPLTDVDVGVVQKFMQHLALVRLSKDVIHQAVDIITVENGFHPTGHLLRRWVDPLVTLEFLLTWNAMRCRPPLDESEVFTIVNSIAGRELKRRGSR